MKQKDGLRTKKVGISLVVVISMLISGIAVLGAPVAIAQETMGGEYGGDLRVALQAEPSSLNPLATPLNEPAEQIIDLLYDSLGRIDPYTLELVPWMASGWEVDAADKSIVRVTLKSGILWHDGTEVTLEDVIYTFGDDGYAIDYISSMSADADNNSVEFDLTQQDARFFAEVMAMKIVQDGTTDASDSEPMGCGPFTLVSSDADSTELAAYDDHFVARPFLDAISFTYYPYVFGGDFSVDYPYSSNFGDIDPRWDGSYRASHDLLTDQIDFIGWGLSTNQTTGMIEVAGNETTLILNPNTTVQGSNGLNSWYLGFNNAPDNILNDPELRKAITYGINKDGLTQYDISGGLETTESIISKYNVPWYNNSLTPYEYDLSKALSILNNAGYFNYHSTGYLERPDGNGSGIPFSLTLLGPPQEDVTPYTMSTNIMTWFADLGLNVSLISNTSESHMVEIEDNNFDMYLADEMSGSVDPQFIYDVYHSESEANLLNFAGTYAVANESELKKIDEQQYKGEWNAETNTPTLNETSDESGWYYYCSVAGTHEFESGSIIFNVGDWVIHDGTEYTKVATPTWTFMLNYTNIIGPVYVYHNGTILANTSWELDYSSGELILKDFPLNFNNDTINVTYNYLPFDHCIEQAGNQMEPADRAVYIKDAQTVIADLCPSVPMFVYKVNHAYVAGCYVGWVKTLGGLGNYWTYTSLKNELVGELDVTLSSFKNSVTEGETISLFLKVVDKDGASIDTAQFEFGEGDFSTVEYDETGEQYTVDYTAPTTIVSKTMSLSVSAFAAGYASATDGLDITVHPTVNNFDVEIVRGDTTLPSGNSTSITVVVTDKATSEVITGATVVLTLSPNGLGGELGDITGTTGSDGRFATTFGSDNVTIDTTFKITADVSMEGFENTQESTSISVSRDPNIVSDSAAQDTGLLGLPAPSFMAVMVMLAAMSMIYAVYRRKD